MIQDYDPLEIPRLAEEEHEMHQIDLYGYVRDEWEGGLGGEIAYIRHCLTNYEAVLEKIKGHVAVGKAYQEIKKALNDKIKIDYMNKLSRLGGYNN